MIDGKGDCHCSQNNLPNNRPDYRFFPLNKLLDLTPSYMSAYPYANKRLSYWSSQIASLLVKIKEKKTLYNG